MIRRARRSLILAIHPGADLDHRLLAGLEIDAAIGFDSRRSTTALGALAEAVAAHVAAHDDPNCAMIPSMSDIAVLRPEPES